VNTDSDLSAAVRREMAAAQLERAALSQPPDPAPDSFAGRLFTAQRERARQEKEAGERYSAECRRVREEHEAERARRWEANAPARQRAQAERVPLVATRDRLRDQLATENAEIALRDEIVCQFDERHWPEPELPPQPERGSPFGGRGMAVDRLGHWGYAVSHG